MPISMTTTSGTIARCRSRALPGALGGRRGPTPATKLLIYRKWYARGYYSTSRGVALQGAALLTRPTDYRSVGVGSTGSVKR
ncbi:hypothetical protein DFAR_30013 [Desulfarculales bacterium]